MYVNQLIQQLLMKQSDTLQSDTLLHNIDSLNISMKKFGAKKIIIDKMTAL